MWTYRCYDDGKQPNLWRRWYDSNPDYQGTHDSIFDILEQQQQWKMPWTRPLGDGLIEVRLHGKVQYRILGYYGDARKEFIVVGTCSHKGNVYTPKDAIKVAKKAMNDIKGGRANAIQCSRPQ